MNGESLPIEEKAHHTVRNYAGKMSLIIVFLSVIWSVFQLYTSGFGILDAMRLRAIHIIFLLIFTFLLYPINKKERKSLSNRINRPPLFDLVLVLLSIISFGYLLVNYSSIALRGGYLVTLDYVFGAIGILLVFEAARRVVGNLAILALIFLLYNFLGVYIPGDFGHGGFSIKRVTEFMFWGSQGIFGIAIGVSSTFVFLFILFGSFLRLSGFSQFINDLALTIAGRSPGGPAKVAVLASSMMGMINGSAIANVATTGTITIPLMKQNGYKARFAAAVEAVASTGGQFAPPIMGAAGFVMAEYLGVPYTTIMLAAIIPAFLYYLTLILIVHFEAKKLGLKGISKENIPNVVQVLKTQGHLLIPLIVLIGLLFAGYTPIYAAVFSIIASVVASWLRKETRMGVKKIIQALEEGAKGAIGVGVACATIGVVIGTVSLTGLGLTLGYTILESVNDSLLVAGLLVMLMSIVLGMGVPGVAAYVIVATVSAPVLIDLGVSPIAAHMFVLIYACLSNITPPVALASYVAAGIANTNQTKVSYTAVKLGLTGFIMPFFFIFDPILLFDGHVTTDFVIAALSATLGVMALSAGLQGWLFTRINIVVRILLFTVSILMIDPTLMSDMIGGGLFILLLVWQFFTRKKNNVKIDATEPVAK
ncbi:TRAP transporter permease [Bacillus sp. B15-48]|uniref:TRAP transporter permease n=1 Tax=Bacillus sp. B15-48 TaxID=1548601 RepID=UPI001EF1A605|nr:TRAP transporter permease [Bacillus sp. B15-48]MBM4763138.1 TRAP transporter fused permease subunit [Bacillus sp. B15-48]